MSFFQDQKAQGAIEYLLLIGGVVLIATIVGFYLKSLPKQVEPGLQAGTEGVLG